MGKIWLPSAGSFPSSTISSLFLVLCVPRLCMEGEATLRIQGSPRSGGPRLPCWNFLTLLWALFNGQLSLRCTHSWVLEKKKKYSGTKEDMEVWHSVKIRQNMPSSQSPKWLCDSCLPVFTAWFRPFPHCTRLVCVTREYDRSNDVSLPTLDSTWHCSFCLGCPLVLYLP